MKKVVYLAIIGLVLIVFACKPGADSYVFSRPTHPQNFKTLLDGEFYTYTSDDVASARADYYLKVIGTIVTYGDTIARYGHCWNTSQNPTDIETETLSTKFENTTLGTFDSISFTSELGEKVELEPGTKYYVRTYIVKINSDGSETVAYNPVVSEIETKPAIDEWFEQCWICNEGNFRPIPDVRFDALAFNLGDTVFFGTGDKGLGIDLNKDIVMYDPTTGEWDTEIIGGLQSNNGLTPELMNGIGFAITFQKANVPEGNLTTMVFVGIGDHGGRDLQAEKSNTLVYRDITNNQWGATKKAEAVFSPRSDGVCFVLNGKAYFGTGYGAAVYNQWFVFDPVAETDLEPTTPAWRSLANSNPPTTPRRGAVAFTANSRGYFGLGVDDEGNFLSDFYSFRPNDPSDPTSGIWTRLADFPGEARANAVAFSIGDQGYVGTGDNLVATTPGNPYYMEEVGGYIDGGQVFSDFWRYNPLTDAWEQIRDFSANKTNREDALRPLTRAVGFSIPSQKFGFVGYGMAPKDYLIPNPPKNTSTINAQKDFWKYQPFNDDAK